MSAIGGDDWPGWDEMRASDHIGGFFGTPIVYPTPRAWGVRQVEWWRNKRYGKVGVVHRWYYKTREAAERKVEREKVRA